MNETSYRIRKELAGYLLRIIRTDVIVKVTDLLARVMHLRTIRTHSVLDWSIDESSHCPARIRCVDHRSHCDSLANSGRNLLFRWCDVAEPSILQEKETSMSVIHSFAVYLYCSRRYIAHRMVQLLSVVWSGKSPKRQVMIADEVYHHNLSEERKEETNVLFFVFQLTKSVSRDMLQGMW